MGIYKLCRLVGSMIKMTINVSKWWAMERKNKIGLVICVTLFCSGFAIHGNVGLYFAKPAKKSSTFLKFRSTPFLKSSQPFL